MNRLTKLFLTSLTLLVLSACFGGGGGTDDDPPPEMPLELATVSGITIDPTGSWSIDCLAESGIEDRIFVFTFSDSTLTIDISFYASQDGSCSGGIDATEIYVANLIPGGAIAISGWDGSGAPMAQDGSGQLSNNETVTPLTATIVSAPSHSGFTPGDTFNIFFVVDDTVPSAPVMYEDADYDSGSTLASDFPVYSKQIDVIQIDVITVSGAMVTLDGTLVRPCDTSSGGTDYLVTESISGISGVMKEFSYTSTDGSCTGIETVDLVAEVTFKKGSVMDITGWVALDGTPVTPPQAQDGSGLSDNESVTSLTLTIDFITPAVIPVGTEIPAFYVVDDTVPAAPVLYGISDDDDQKAYNVPMTLQ